MYFMLWILCNFASFKGKQKVKKKEKNRKKRERNKIWVAHAHVHMAQPSSSDINSFFQGTGRMWNNPIHKHFMHVLSVLWKFLPGKHTFLGVFVTAIWLLVLQLEAHDAEEGKRQNNHQLEL